LNPSASPLHSSQHPLLATSPCQPAGELCGQAEGFSSLAPVSRLTLNSVAVPLSSSARPFAAPKANPRALVLAGRERERCARGSLSRAACGETGALFRRSAGLEGEEAVALSQPAELSGGWRGER